MARSLLATLTAVLVMTAPVCQGALTTPPTGPTTGAVATAKEPKAPTWLQLTAQQRQSLAPLADEWNQMPDRQRKKLVGVANQYPKMKPQEQQRVKERLTQWAKLSQQERELARERYKKMRKLPPEKHKEVKKKWEQYQAEKKQATQAWQPTDQTQPYVTQEGAPSTTP